MGCNKSTPEETFRSSSVNTSRIEISKPRVVLQKKLISTEVGSINEHYRILKAVGTTTTGTLLYAKDIQTGTNRAIREINKSLIKDSPNIYSEISILSELDHPNIVKIFQTIETSINYYMVFEIIEGGNLQSRIKRSGSEMQILKYMHDILSALYYMHIRNIVHCDLTPLNILFTSNDENAIPKIVGFSSVQNLIEKHSLDVNKLSYVYVSPDILKKNYNEKTDMWSLGIIIYEILIGKNPYSSKDKRGTLKEIFKGNLDFENPHFKNLSFNAQDFIKKLLAINPEDRLSAKEALSHPWLSQATKEAYYNYEILEKLRTFKVSNI